jgi:hypothetical protein
MLTIARRSPEGAQAQRCAMNAPCIPRELSVCIADPLGNDQDPATVRHRPASEGVGPYQDLRVGRVGVQREEHWSRPGSIMSPSRQDDVASRSDRFDEGGLRDAGVARRKQRSLRDGGEQLEQAGHSNQLYVQDGPYRLTIGGCIGHCVVAPGGTATRFSMTMRGALGLMSALGLVLAGAPARADESENLHESHQRHAPEAFSRSAA